MTDIEIEQEVHSISMELDSAEHDLVSSVEPLSYIHYLTFSGIIGI